MGTLQTRTVLIQKAHSCTWTCLAPVLSLAPSVGSSTAVTPPVRHYGPGQAGCGVANAPVPVDHRVRAARRFGWREKQTPFSNFYLKHKNNKKSRANTRNTIIHLPSLILSSCSAETDNESDKVHIAHLNNEETPFVYFNWSAAGIMSSRTAHLVVLSAFK